MALKEISKEEEEKYIEESIEHKRNARFDNFYAGKVAVIELESGLNFWKRKRYPLRSFVDVIRYNMFVVPKVNKARKNAKTKEEKERFDRGIYKFISTIIDPDNYGTPEKEKEYMSSTQDSILSLSNTDKEKYQSVIYMFGGDNHFNATARVWLDKAIIDQLKITFSNALRFKEKLTCLYYYSPIKHFATFLMSKFDKTILALEINNFPSSFHNWNTAIEKSKRERNKHNEEDNEHLLN